jgi:hypothetical protein
MKLKNDRYKKARGGYSRLLEIRCAHCGVILCHYQKDGPGSLKRMYLDRISNSVAYGDLQNLPLKKLPQLTCGKCGRHLGVPIIWEKETRPAFRLFEGAVAKKIVKG